MCSGIFGISAEIADYAYGHVMTQNQPMLRGLRLAGSSWCYPKETSMADQGGWPFLSDQLGDLGNVPLQQEDLENVTLHDIDGKEYVCEVSC